MADAADDFESSMLEEISMGGTSRLEFIGDPSEEQRRFIRTAVAFSNGSGGRILFGVRDDHEIVGIPDDTSTGSKMPSPIPSASPAIPRSSLRPTL